MPQAYELTGVPPSGPLWKATPAKAAKLGTGPPKAERDTMQRLNPFSVFIEVCSDAQVSIAMMAVVSSHDSKPE